MATEEITKDLGYIKLAAKVWNNKGIPVLALHGWLDNAASYDCLAPLLSGTQFIALDMAGHGLSGHRAGRHYYIWENIGDIKAFTDSLGWERFVLIGHSMGAAVASLFAGTYPQSVERLVLIEGLGPLSEEANKSPERFVRAIRETSLLPEKNPPCYASEQEAVLLRSKAGISMEAARLIVARGLMYCEDGYQWRSDPALTLPSHLYLDEEQVLAFLREITAPSCFIVAEQGILHLDKFAAERQAAISNLQVYHLPGNHHLHLEAQAPLVADAIRDFIFA